MTDTNNNTTPKNQQKFRMNTFENNDNDSESAQILKGAVKNERLTDA